MQFLSHNFHVALIYTVVLKIRLFVLSTNQILKYEVAIKQHG